MYVTIEDIIQCINKKIRDCLNNIPSLVDRVFSSVQFDPFFKTYTPLVKHVSTSYRNSHIFTKLMIIIHLISGFIKKTQQTLVYDHIAKSVTTFSFCGVEQAWQTHTR